MPDLERRLGEGRRAVATMDPPVDLWERVVERSEHGDSVVIDLAAVRRRHTSAWLVAAAVVVLIALAGALVLYADDDDPVHTVDVGPEPDTEAPGVTVPQAPRPNTVVSGVGCPFGISGEPIDMNPGLYEPPGGDFFGGEAEPGQGAAYAIFGAQVAEVLVPGFKVNTAGWHFEDVELERGTARLWLDGPASGPRGLPFVQVGWFPDTDEPCSSFSVKVDGGSVGENRRTAVALADRMVLPAEMLALDLPGAEGGPVAGLTLTDTEWEIASYPASGQAGVSFTDTTVTWDNGCGTVTADYELDRLAARLTLSDRVESDPGCVSPTLPGDVQPRPTINSVMGIDRIPVSYSFGFPGGPAENAGPVLTLSYLGLIPA
jgi:hypothetical protein